MISDINIYANFVVNAILGLLNEADALMGHDEFAPAIRSVARYLTKRMPIEPKPLYRGVLLDPSVRYAPRANIKFMSWSEDLDVARWFASPHTVISEPAIANNPRLRGYLMTQGTCLATRGDAEILFHHAWARLFNGLAPLALLHPEMGPNGARQITWALRTQKEVITTPVAHATPFPIDVVDHHALEQKFAPPWIAHEGII